MLKLNNIRLVDRIDAEFPIITDTKKFINKKVHVDGWNIACVFYLKGVKEDGTYILETPKTKKIYETKNKLRELRRC